MFQVSSTYQMMITKSFRGSLALPGLHLLLWGGWCCRLLLFLFHLMPQLRVLPHKGIQAVLSSLGLTNTLGGLGNPHFLFKVLKRRFRFYNIFFVL